MKKLLVALGAVAMAACAQAASINWSATVASLTTPDSSYVDYNVYLCETLAAEGFKSESDIENYLYGTGGNTGVTTKKGTRSPYTYSATGMATGIDDGDAGMKTVYAVVVSKDGKGYWTAETQGEVYTTALEPVEAKFDFKTIVAGAYTPWAGSEPVPEPTSGLLLLLGVAGLALRRKQK